MSEEIHVILYGKKVNVTKWANSHPGGKHLLETFHLRDATEQFEVCHSKEAMKQLETVFLPKSPAYVSNSTERTTASTVQVNTALWNAGSTTKKEEGPLRYNSKIAVDFVKFRKELEDLGLFKTNIVAEGLMMLYTLFMIFGGYYIALFSSYPWVGLTMLGLGFLQAGWVAHDYLHHAVCNTVYMNDVIGTFMGAIQGFDGDWWKNRHNAHHVATNEVMHDPDISIAPILHFVQQYPDLKSTLKHIQKYQHLYYLPLLTLLDVAWRVESILWAKSKWNKDKKRALFLGIHYAFFFYLGYSLGFFPALYVSLLRGFLMAVIVFASHYTEERYVGNVPANFSLCEQTARTTRNISGGFLMNFISGNISLQIEHHLFPTMPPHNLLQAVPHVKRFFVEHDLPYQESSIFECVSRMLDSLNMDAAAPPSSFAQHSKHAKQS